MTAAETEESISDIFVTLKKIAGPLVAIITVVIGIFSGKRSYTNNPGDEHRILEGKALNILRENRIDDWGAKETSIVTYSLLAKPLTSFNKTLHMLYYLLGSGSFALILNLMLDRLLLPS